MTLYLVGHINRFHLTWYRTKNVTIQLWAAHHCLCAFLKFSFWVDMIHQSLLIIGVRYDLRKVYTRKMIVVGWSTWICCWIFSYLLCLYWYDCIDQTIPTNSYLHQITIVTIEPLIIIGLLIKTHTMYWRWYRRLDCLAAVICNILVILGLL